jgi:hypothetical protein
MIKSISSFSLTSILLSNINKFNLGLIRMNKIGVAMHQFAKNLNKINKNYKDVFNNDGIGQNIAKTISSIVDVIPNKDAVDPIWELISALQALSDIKWNKLSNLQAITETISGLTKQINKLNEEKIDSLSKLGIGLQIISLVDEKKLKQTLDIIEKKSTALKEITDDGSLIRNIFDKITNKTFDNTKNDIQYDKNNVDKPTNTKKENTFEEQLLSHIKNIDTNIIKMSDIDVTVEEERLKSQDVDE